MTRSLVFLTALAAISAALAAPYAASNLRVEYMDRPTIDVAHPRFSYEPTSFDRASSQASYHIIVSSVTNNALVWDSLSVVSSQTSQIAYAGIALVSDAIYNWTVTWTDSTGATAPAASGIFGTGLLTQAEWMPAAWVGCPLHTASTPNYNQLRAEFTLAPNTVVRQAKAYLAAVGYASLRVNGDWAPHFSGVHPRNDPGWTTWELRALYSTYDLTTVLTQGSNAIAIALGNGWPDIGPVPGNGTTGQSVDANSGHLREARLMILVHDSAGNVFQWTTTAGSFETSSTASASWSCGSGAQLDDSVYNGVTYDARLETTGWDLPNYVPDASATNWTAAVLHADPGGAAKTLMSSQAFPVISVHQEFTPLTMSSPSPGVTIYDFGQNMAGFIRLTLPAPLPAGITIVIRHAEVLQHPPYGPKDGNIYVGNLRSAKATETYTTRGTEDADEVFEPQFTYHGFRYVEITGLPFTPSLDTITALSIRSGVELVGALEFSSSANVLNQLAHAVQWGIGANLMSVVSDCPQRDERKGWMGDSGLSLTPTHYTYGVGAFYTAWANNIRDSQMSTLDHHPVGSVPDTVPHTFGDYPSDPSWGTAYPGVVFSTWRVYGDARIATDHWPNLILYVNFMLGCVNKTGMGKLYQSYGDWCPPPAQMGGGQGPKPPDHFTSGVALLTDLGRMIELAAVVGTPADVTFYTNTRNALANDFNTAWLNAGIYGNANGDGLQTAHSAAVALGIVPPSSLASVSSALVTDVTTTHNGHWGTGIIGMRYLHGSLTSIGAGEAALDTLLQTDYPSYGFWFAHPDEPATTLLELPDGPSEGPGMNSRNHHMFASVGGWLWEDLLGLGQARTGTSSYSPTNSSAHGFTHAIIFPRVPFHQSLSSASGTYRSSAGLYSVAWSRPTPANCVANAIENAPVSLSCNGAGIISAVTFASFGTPTGTCATGFSKGTCDAANSTAIVTAACVGKTSCSIDVSDINFGDPCFDVVKSFSALVVCSQSSGSSTIDMIVTIPTNAAATVRLPFNTNAPPPSITIYESGNIVWASGAFVPGVVGVTSAKVSTSDVPVGMSTIDFEVLSGTYSFSS